MQDGVYEANLIMAKNRIAPKRTLSIPRLKLCAAAIATRLRKKIEELMDYQFRKVYHLTDSRIVRDQIKSESHRFRTVTAVQVGEIQENSYESEWWWIPFEYNSADMLTRPNKRITKEDEVFWMKGPAFFSQHFEAWPIEDNGKKDAVIGIETVDTFTVMSVMVDELAADVGTVNINQFNDFKKLIETTSIVLEIISKRTFDIYI